MTKLATRSTNRTDIQIYDLSTFLQTGTITASGTPQEVFIDNSGRYLFADNGTTTQVFSTGRSVPEPSLVSVTFGGCLLTLMGRRRRAISE